jgi:hypothetical protein
MWWLLLFLVACAPEAGTLGFALGNHGEGEHDPTTWLEDRWTDTYAACQPPEPFYVTNNADDYWALQFHDPACLDRLDQDLGIDVPSFAAANDEWMLRILRFAMYALLGADMGRVDELADPDDDRHEWAVRAPFIETVRDASDILSMDEVRQVVYNIVASTIVRTRYIHDEDIQAVASMDLETRTLRIYPMWRMWALSSGGAGVLVHEASHAWLDSVHVLCPEDVYENAQVFGTMVLPTGLMVCDAGWDGAYGHQLGVLQLTRDRYPEIPDDEGDDMEREDLGELVGNASFYIIEEWGEGGVWASSRSDGD